MSGLSYIGVRELKRVGGKRGDWKVIRRDEENNLIYLFFLLFHSDMKTIVDNVIKDNIKCTTGKLDWADKGLSPLLSYPRFRIESIFLWKKMRRLFL